ncbi:MAG: transporter substrate-binding domain-containing protein [Bacteroidales bacterium]|nr:transporter substrate-binding domain-containing protein [Bacteroidales bacterium]
MQKLYILTLIAILLGFSACQNIQTGGQKESGQQGSEETVEIKVSRDLPKIKEDGVLKAITTYSSTSYFLYRGKAMGYEYELLERLADYLDLKLEMVVAENLNKMIEMLNNGDGDIIAHGLTITKPRKRKVTFTRHHITTHQSLVQKKPDNWRRMKLHQIDKKLIRDPLELIGKQVHVRKNSSYYHRLVNLSAEMGADIDIQTVSGDLTTEDLIKMVRDGNIKYTVADHNIAALNKTYYPILDISVPLSFSQRIAWAVRNNSPKLLEAVNEWIDKMRKEPDYYVIYNKYFENTKAWKRRIKSEFYSKTGNRISKYDPIIKKYAEQIDWDWRLLASMIYQESRFDPSVRSWAGAKGLMQLMPRTASHYGVSNLSNPESSVKGGAAFIADLLEYWKKIPDSTQRMKFVMASYNVGQGHVSDARRLASKYGRDENQWEDNTAYYILQKSKPKYYNDKVVNYGYCRGEEPFNYVHDIFERYEHYKRFIEK